MDIFKYSHHGHRSWLLHGIVLGNFGLTISNEESFPKNSPPAVCLSFRPEKVSGLSRNRHLGPVSHKSRELFGPEKLVFKLQSSCFEKLIFEHFFSVRKTKRTAKFDGLEPQRCEDIKGIVAPEIGPKSFGTFRKQAPGQCF